MAAEKKIFIAEDDPDANELYRMVLASEGCQVQTAFNGKEALEKIPAQRPDLIILDVMMPETDGNEVCRQLRKTTDFALTPIIMLTALAKDEDRIKGYEVGADDYITKPVSLKVLKARVRSILTRSGQRRLEPAAAPPSITEPGATSPGQGMPAIKALKPDEDVLEQLFGTPVPPGSTILIVGPLGSGKSFFSRLFLAQGLRKGDRCMFISVDDDPSAVRRELSQKYQLDVANFEKENLVRFVDAYSWSAGRVSSQERFAIRGILELSDLSAFINEAGAELGQTDQADKGGRRVMDSISSLLLNFELSYVQRFIAFLARSGHFAGVTTILVVEQDASDDQTLNNIKYITDGVLEFKTEDQRFIGRVGTMKWGTPEREWTDMTWK